MKDKDLDKLFQEASKKASFGDAAAGWNDMKTKLKGAGIAPAPRKSWFNLNSILLILLLLMIGAGSVMYFVNDNSAAGSRQLASKEVSSSDKHNIHGQNTSSNVDRNLDSIVDTSDSEEGSSADQLTDNEEIKASISTSDSEEKSHLSSEQLSQLNSSSEFNSKSDEQLASIGHIEGHDGQSISDQSNPAELAGTKADLDDSEQNSLLSQGKGSETELENSKSDVIIATDNVSKEDSSGFMVDDLSSALPDYEITENKLNEEDKTILVTGNLKDDVIITNESSDDLEDQTANVPSDNSQSPKGFEERVSDGGSDRLRYTYYAGPSLLRPIKITLSHSLSLPSPELAKVSFPQQTKTEDQEENSFLRSRWSIGLEFSPDLSTVGLRGIEDPGYTVGLHVEYHLSSKLSLSGGVSYSKKIYFADEDIESYPGSNPNWTLDRVNANCDVIDIPVNLSYYQNGYDASGFVFSGGLSTYFMLTEDYDIIYNDPWPEGSQFFRNENQHFLGILNLSVGYRKRLSPILSLQAEPFIKIPIQGIGAGDLDLYTSGLRFILKYNRRSLGQN